MMKPFQVNSFHLPFLVNRGLRRLRSLAGADGFALSIAGLKSVSQFGGPLQIVPFAEFKKQLADGGFACRAGLSHGLQSLTNVPLKPCLFIGRLGAFGPPNRHGYGKVRRVEPRWALRAGRFRVRCLHFFQAGIQRDSAYAASIIRKNAIRIHAALSNSISLAQSGSQRFITKEVLV